MEKFMDICYVVGAYQVFYNIGSAYQFIPFKENIKYFVYPLWNLKFLPVLGLPLELNMLAVTRSSIPAISSKMGLSNPPRKGKSYRHNPSTVSFNVKEKAVCSKCTITWPEWIVCRLSLHREARWNRTTMQRC